MKFNISKLTNKFQKRHHRLWLSFVGACIICLIIIGFLLVTSHTTITPMTSSNYPTFTSPPVTQNVTARTTYTDPQNYFHISIPANWHTESESGTNTITDGTSQQAITQQIEISKLYLSNTQGITIQVFNGVPTCPLTNPLTTILAGFPASSDAVLNTWTIPTTKATVTVSIFYPGSTLDYHEFMQNRASQSSSSDIENNKRYLTKILNTLTLTNLTPYNCK